MSDIPTPRGTLAQNRPLSRLTWLRVGGPAEYFFQPADIDDLVLFLSNLAPKMLVFPIGVGSNLIVRDGGVRGVVIRLGRGFNHIQIDGNTVIAGAAAMRLALRSLLHPERPSSLPAIAPPDLRVRDGADSVAPRLHRPAHPPWRPRLGQSSPQTHS